MSKDYAPMSEYSQNMHGVTFGVLCQERIKILMLKENFHNPMFEYCQSMCKPSHSSYEQTPSQIKHCSTTYAWITFQEVMKIKMSMGG